MPALSEHDTTHGACGKTWKQRGNRTGHCSGERWSAVGLTIWDSDSLLSSKRDPALDERAVYGRGVSANDLPDLVGAQAFQVQPRRIRVPSDIGMSEVVFLGSKRDKVLGSVIAPVPVDVVNLLFINNPAVPHPVLVGLDVAVRGNLPSEADVSMAGRVTTRLAVRDALAGVEIVRRRSVAAFPTGAAELLLGSTSDGGSAGNAGLSHVAILQVAALCHETFEGETLFDAHRVTLEDGTRGCLDPATMKHAGQPLRLINGSWRGPGMTDEALARRKGAA